ncbi:MAG: hypothetical protein ACI837_000602 [Crocinitomicaceae bacterium]|jgi:hypothetical protein
MKHWIIFIALFSIHQVNACGPWYPYGEEVRFSLFNPAQFDDGSMSRFYYTADNYGDDAISSEKNDANTLLWSKYCNGEVALAEIYEAVYTLERKALESKNTSNEMIRYLMAQKDYKALAYLEFAKSCSPLNSVRDPWEKDDATLYGKRKKKISKALKAARKTKNPQLKKRYQFLALRLAFYNGNEIEVEKNYQANFSGMGEKDLLDYWALHFVSVLAPTSAETNFQLAQVFAHAPGKRFAVNLAFERQISLEKVLEHATTDEERANVYIMYAIREKGRSDETIKKIYSLNPDCSLLPFLIIREVNKIEDWILTPRYSMFPPAMTQGEFYSLKVSDLLAERQKEDRAYAEGFGLWLRSTKWRSAENKDLFLLSTCYLFGAAGSDLLAEEASRVLFLNDDLTELRNQVLLVQQIRLHPEIKLSKEQELLLMDEASNNHEKFLFAVAREHEYNGNHVLAAALFSHLNVKGGYNNLSWRSPDGRASLWADFYTEWFFYLEGQYTPQQVEDVIEFANQGAELTDKFGIWMREYLKPHVNRLHDLVGTQYIRLDDLDQAIIAFKKVKPGLWDSENYPYMTYLNANPFYTDFNSEHTKTPGDTIRYNKLQIAEKLREYIDLANNPSTSNRAYYYFQVANCYLNMTDNGNSWMMRRYYWSANGMETYLEDEDEYLKCINAKKYYLLAMKHSPTKTLQSLCLRMAGRCESYQLFYEVDYDYNKDYSKYGGYHNYVDSKNTSFSELKKSYPESYKTMMDNCTTFEKYYAQF